MEKALKRISEKIKRKVSGIRDLKKLAVLGLTGMILILVSFFIPDRDESKYSEETEYKVSEYAEYTERQIENILGKIKGVGKVSVMLSVEGTEEYVYAQESKENTSSGENSNSSQTERKIIFEQKDGEKTALVKKIINPAVKGVAIVCDGGDNSQVREKITEAVSVSLNVPVSRIFVAGSKE